MSSSRLISSNPTSAALRRGFPTIRPQILFSALPWCGFHSTNITNLELTFFPGQKPGHIFIYMKLGEHDYTDPILPYPALVLVLA